MTVKELIIALIDCDMNKEVILCCPDKNCIGETAGFHIKQMDDTNIIFDDWRDNKVMDIIDKYKAESEE